MNFLPSELKLDSEALCLFVAAEQMQATFFTEKNSTNLKNS